MNKKQRDPIKSNFLKGIIAENQVFVALLAMCPILATTSSLEAAFGMGLLVLLSLCSTNVIISLIRKLIPQEVKIPAYIVTIAGVVTVIKMLCNALLPELYNSLGVFISLIVVNCIILSRADSYASKHGPFDSLIDALGMGLGFTMSLMIVAFFRELLGTGGLTFGQYFPLPEVISFRPLESVAIKIFVDAPGGFMVLGFILAFLAWRSNTKQQKIALEKKKALEAAKLQKQATKEATA